MAAGVIEVDDKTFESEVLQSDQVVLVDFWAPWCGPCRMIAPVIEQLAAENSGTAKIVKVNTDEAQDTAHSYGVSSIPTLMVFKNGEAVNRMLGVQPKPRLQEAIDEAKG